MVITTREGTESRPPQAIVRTLWFEVRAMRDAIQGVVDVIEEVVQDVADLYRSIRGLPPRRPVVVPVPVRAEEDRRRV
jgi:hypothetical protein